MFPIESVKKTFLTSVNNNPLTLLIAPPGAGKSTVLPLWFLEQSCEGRILLLQPRRVAAKNIAIFLAKQLNQNVGGRVGYRLRNDTKVSKSTKLEVITEGVLLRMLQNDPELEGIGCILFDEFHERSAQADLAFALARDVQLGLRDDLALVLMSATLENQSIQAKLPEAELIVSDGKMFDVEIAYQAPASLHSWLDDLIKVIKQQSHQLTGTALVFLPGRFEIEKAKQALDMLPNDIIVTCLFGDMPLEEQQKAIAKAPNSQSKIVLSTNIAETSLTIDGVNVVIDSGLEKQAIFDVNTQTNRLELKRIAQASAIQRAGRAGRLMAGRCIRLYSQHDFERMAEFPPLAILQTDLVPVVLEASRWGVNKLASLPLLTLPKSHLEKLAWQQLEQLTLVNKAGKLTKHGQACSRLACHPRFAHMIESAYVAEQEGHAGLTLLACLVASLLENKDIISSKQGYSNVSLASRVDTLIVKGERRFPFIFKQAKQLLSSYHGVSTAELSELPMSLLAVLVAWAFPERIAKARNQAGNFVSIYNKGYQLAVDDSLCDAGYLSVAHLSQIKQNLTVRIAEPLTIAQIKQWKLAPISQQDVCHYDSKKDRIDAFECELVGQLLVDKKSQKQTLTTEAVTLLWQQQIEKNGLDWLKWQPADKQLVLRWRWLNKYQSHLDLPLMDDEFLFEKLNTWLLPFIGQCYNKKALDQVSLLDLLLNLLNYEQQRLLSKCAPTYYKGPTGRNCPITYDLDNAPRVSLPMQEVYGLAQSPQIGDIAHGKGVSLVLEMLSPAKRPIQVTQDLSQFWQGSYQAVQKEMKSKYPKHFWPDDPANAQPTNKTKKYM